MPPGSVSAEAVVVNGRGQVAGIATGADGYPRGFFWENGVMQDIGTLGTHTYVFDMNQQGAIVGWSARSSTSFRHAIVWQRGALVDLGPANAFFSQAVAINERGVIAGNTASDPSLRQAGMWQPVTGTDSTTLVASARNVRE